MIQKYKTQKFHAATLEVIRQANEICAEYADQGYDLTLRQLFYQFVARGLILNSDKEYTRLGKIVNDARMAGRMDWDYIVDRTRNLRTIGMWDSPEDILNAVSRQFRTDRWARQDEYVEVWIEKDALIGVLAGVCPEPENGVPFFSCRGYPSVSEMWSAAQRFGKKINAGKKVVSLHLGDHDPSGVDMTRDIEERLYLFLADFGSSVRNSFAVERIALTMEQVEEYNPPPNSAKQTDVRAKSYIKKYGRDSWELDALDPAVLAALVQEHIDRHRDQELWDEAEAEDQDARDILAGISDHWEPIQQLVARLNGSTVDDARVTRTFKTGKVTRTFKTGKAE